MKTSNNPTRSIPILHIFWGILPRPLSPVGASSPAWFAISPYPAWLHPSHPPRQGNTSMSTYIGQRIQHDCYLKPSQTKSGEGLSGSHSVAFSHFQWFGASSATFNSILQSAAFWSFNHRARQFLWRISGPWTAQCTRPWKRQYDSKDLPEWSVGSFTVRVRDNLSFHLAISWDVAFGVAKLSYRTRKSWVLYPQRISLHQSALGSQTNPFKM